MPEPQAYKASCAECGTDWISDGKTVAGLDFDSVASGQPKGDNCPECNSRIRWDEQKTALRKGIPKVAKKTVVLPKPPIYKLTQEQLQRLYDKVKQQKKAK